MSVPDESHFSQLRLLMEELCCDLCRFEHVTTDGLLPENIRIEREYYLGLPGAFGDIVVMRPGQAPYAVEVKYGYPSDIVVRHLRRKYAEETEESRKLT